MYTSEEIRTYGTKQSSRWARQVISAKRQRDENESKATIQSGSKSIKL